MQALFGMPGPMELLIIGLICVMVVGLPVVIIAAVLLVNRKNRGDG